MERMSKTMAEGKEDLERAFNIMNEELLKAEYKARVEPYGKSMNEILEEFAKETKAYKELEEENKKLKEEIKSRQEEVERFKTNAMQDMTEITELEIENKKLKAELELKNLALKQAQEGSILI